MGEVIAWVLLVVVVIGSRVYVMYAVQNAMNGDNTADIVAYYLQKTYNERMDWFRHLNQKASKGGIVFVGDSLTQGYLLKDMFGDLRLHNRGISGDTTHGVLKRMNESFFDLEPEKAFLQIGINDFELNQPKETIVENIKLICKQVVEKEIKLYLIGLYPINNSDDSKIDERQVESKTNDEIKQINRELERFCEEIGIPFIDLYEVLIDEEDQLKLDYTVEGLHMSPLGYEVITEELKKYI